VLVPALFGVFPQAPPATLFGSNKGASIWGTAWATGQYARRVELNWLNDLILEILRWIIAPFRWIYEVTEGLPEVFRWLIVAAMILAISRAIGETMIVALAAGATAGSLFTLNPLGPGQTLTGAMASLAAGSDQVAGANAAFQSLFFVGLLLFVMTLVLNVIGDSFVRRTRQKY